MQDYRSLRVWQLSHSLTLDVYRVTRNSMGRGNYALVSQLQRAAVSVGANIAEGCGRAGRRELARFLEIAAASAHELQYHLLLARDLGLLAAPDWLGLDAKTTSVKRMLTVLVRRVREQREAPLAAAKAEAACSPSTDDRLP